MELLEEQATGQGFATSQVVKKAIEDHAMDAAKRYFVGLGYSVEDRSATHSYDLRCTRPGQVLYVEVKGTTTAGASILLTPNEVAFARRNYPNTVLFILASISINPGGPVIASGGVTRVIQPWDVDKAPSRPSATL